MATNKKPSKKYVPGKHLPKLPRQVEANQRLDGSFVDRQQFVANYRRNTTRVLRDIENGIVDADDLAKLRNFVQGALAAMERMPMADIDKAWRNAEATSIIHHEMGIEFASPDEDCRIVPDPRVRGLK